MNNIVTDFISEYSSSKKGLRSARVPIEPKGQNQAHNLIFSFLNRTAFRVLKVICESAAYFRKFQFYEIAFNVNSCVNRPTWDFEFAHFFTAFCIVDQGQYS